MLELDLAVELVVNATIRADGKVYNISIVGSRLDGPLVGGAGRLKERFTGVPGAEGAIGSFIPVTD